MRDDERIGSAGASDSEDGAVRSVTLAVAADEQGFVARLRARDEAAFVELFDRHHGALLRLAQLFVSSRAVAEEVAQETWLAVMDGIDRFEGRSSLKTWIFRILTNRAKSRGVREKRTVPFSDMTRDDEPNAPAVEASRFLESGRWASPPRAWSTDAADRRLMARQALEVLGVALDALPPNQRAVVTLRDIEGLDSSEVCDVLGVSDANLRVLLHRARSKLRAALEAHVEDGD